MMTRNHRRRTTLLVMFAASVIVLAGTWAYAMSLEHWGETRELIFAVLTGASLAIGLIALLLLVTDVARARRG